MKVHNYIDLINIKDRGWNAYKLDNLRKDLIDKLPNMDIIKFSSVLLIRPYQDDLYAVKIRDPFKDKILNSEFIVISKEDYSECKDWIEYIYKTRELITPGGFVIYEMTEWKINDRDQLERIK